MFLNFATKIMIMDDAVLMSTHNVCFLGKRQFDFTVQMQETWFILVHRKLIFTCVSLFFMCLFVLRFYGPVNPMGSCQARSVYLTTRLLGRLSPLSG